jgi:hypothetical protein
LALAYLLWLSQREPGEIRDLTRFTGLSRDHQLEVTYEATGLPPAGGVHAPTWQNCGVYQEPVEIKYALHSLEHGALWLTYDPALAAEEIAQLEAIGRDLTFVIVSPFPGQSSPIAATVWGIQLTLDDAGDRRLGDFVERYRLGPQTPELGGACTEGVGDPAT